MTDKHNVGAESRITATPSTINSTCMLVIGKNAGFRNRFCRINEFRFRRGVYIRQLRPTAYPYRPNRPAR
jgi:hypothetical protein